MSSLGSTTTRAVRPWRSAFKLERTLPFGETGPVDLIELSRLAAYCKGEGISIISGTVIAGEEGAGRLKY